MYILNICLYFHMIGLPMLQPAPLLIHVCVLVKRRVSSWTDVVLLLYLFFPYFYLFPFSRGVQIPCLLPTSVTHANICRLLFTLPFIYMYLRTLWKALHIYLCSQMHPYNNMLPIVLCDGHNVLQNIRKSCCISRF